MFKRILVATDHSDHARKAVQTAAGLVARCDAKLTIVNAFSESDVPDEYIHLAEVEHLLDEASRTENRPATVTMRNFSTAERARLAPVFSENILKRAADAARKAGAGDVTTVSLNAPPADAIIDQAKSTDADLVVVGTRGLGRIQGMILGSVSHKLVQFAPCSCLTVK